MNILVAEDDSVSRRILHRNLTRLGHTVSEAGNGVEAWSILQHEPIRIVVSDWMMPEMSGLELCRHIRERNDSNYTYFILLTAREGDENYREAMTAGVDDFLTKPLDREELEIRLRVAERIIGFATQVRQLKELLPICMYCKKIRDDHDYWKVIEEYIHQYTGTDFSHGICPDCYEKIAVPQIEAALRNKTGAQLQESRQ
ncbi:MAG TPA: response regulator [Verrucomicrobiae bacterium]|nr:response regulator [Verrucomicrobiae bacterium]